MTDDQWKELEPLAKAYCDGSRKFDELVRGGFGNDPECIRVEIEVDCARRELRAARERMGLA